MASVIRVLDSVYHCETGDYRVGVAYRSILSFNPKESSVAELSAHVTFWLLDKNWEVPASPGIVQGPSGDSTLSYSEIQDPFFARRWTLTEIWPQSRELQGDRESITSVTLIDRGTLLWLWIEIETPDKVWTSSKTGATFSEPLAAGTPRIIQALLSEAKPLDGTFPLAKEPVIIEANLFGALMVAMEDNQRFGAMMVTAPPVGVTDAEWKSKLETLLRPSLGMGNAFVIPLKDLSRFNASVGFALSVSPGSIRTYLPGVNFGDPGDAYRHKKLTFATLSSMTERRVAHFLRFSQISRLRTVHIPSFMIEAERSLIRRLRFGSSNSTLGPTQSVPLEEVVSYREIAELYEREASQFKSELEEARFESELLRSDLSEAAEENHRLGNLVAFLRQKLVAIGQAEAAYQQPIQEELPTSFEALLDAIREMPLLEFAGDPDEALRLDRMETPPVALQKAWGAVLTLKAYAEFKKTGRFSGGLDDYLRDTSHGGYTSITRVKPESESVFNNPKFRVTREIQVSEVVSRTGRVICHHHIDLARGGGYPRLYFYDATASVGLVYIGHLGVHLENTLSN